MAVPRPPLDDRLREADYFAAAKARSAAANVASMTADVCAVDRKLASNCDGASDDDVRAWLD